MVIFSYLFFVKQCPLAVKQGHNPQTKVITVLNKILSQWAINNNKTHY